MFKHSVQNIWTPLLKYNVKYWFLLRYSFNISSNSLYSIQICFVGSSHKVYSWLNHSKLNQKQTKLRSTHTDVFFIPSHAYRKKKSFINASNLFYIWGPLKISILFSLWSPIEKCALWHNKGYGICFYNVQTNPHELHLQHNDPLIMEKPFLNHL